MEKLKIDIFALQETHQPFNAEEEDEDGFLTIFATSVNNKDIEVYEKIKDK